MYDTASGDTHYLSPLTWAIYQQLNRSSPKATRGTLHTVFSSDNPADIDTALAQLEQMGLIAPV